MRPTVQPNASAHPPPTEPRPRMLACFSGEGGIRTLEAGQPRPRDFQSRSLSHSDTSPCRAKGSPNDPLQPEAANALLAPADVVRELVAERPLDLPAQYLPVPAEVALEGVLVEHDAVLVLAAREVAAEVVAVCAGLGTALRDHYRRVLEHLLELGPQAVDRVGHREVDLARLRGELRRGRKLLAAPHEPL